MFKVLPFPSAFVKEAESGALVPEPLCYAEAAQRAKTPVAKPSWSWASPPPNKEPPVSSPLLEFWYRGVLISWVWWAHRLPLYPLDMFPFLNTLPQNQPWGGYLEGSGNKSQHGYWVRTWRSKPPPTLPTVWVGIPVLSLKGSVALAISPYLLSVSSSVK